MNSDTTSISDSITDLQKFLGMIAPVRETITQLPRGSWIIDIQAGYDRDLFINQKEVKIQHPVFFKSINSALEKFYGKERQAGDDLAAGLKPLEALYKQKNPKLLTDQEPFAQALLAVEKYSDNMKTHPAAISILESALKLSLQETKEELDTYLKGLPAGQEEAIAFYQGFESQMKNTISELKEILLEKIPGVINMGLNVLNALKKS